VKARVAQQGWRPYREGLAAHSNPESCVGTCEEVGEALTGADVRLVCRVGTGRRSQSLSGFGWFAYPLPT